MRNLIYDDAQPHHKLDSRSVRNLIYDDAQPHYELDSRQNIIYCTQQCPALSSSSFARIIAVPDYVKVASIVVLHTQ
jgi:hypothetical protein